jgi:hypothetical protein
MLIIITYILPFSPAEVVNEVKGDMIEIRRCGLRRMGARGNLPVLAIGI